uniref:Thioredoxin domain-containing protein 9 n=1 Tax=Ciona intestinalis TaxID=7719 RepID=F6WUF6_CIOIN|nr:thioredoxin domain-containing protein 9-like [Ciona intestinalis]|eukprot:XP_002131804.1 thioredoxin domain-containing protein 9-like [Ciona intestinalis]
MESLIEQQLLQAAQVVEQQVDAEINRLESMDEDELEKIRERRVQAMKKAQVQKQEWISKGHGMYSELSSEKEFFDICKESKHVVCHFYKNSSFRCKILDSHLSTLAQQHCETKFIKLDVEKAPFLTERLGIRIIPTMAMVKDSKTQGYIVGFTDLGNCDDFSTEMLEWRLGCSEMVRYKGDLATPPDNRKASSSRPLTEKPKKTIRGREEDSEDSDYES